MTPALIVLAVLGVFALCFAAVLFFLRATKAEITLRNQLEAISNAYRTRTPATTILRETKLSPSPQVHELLVRTPVALPLLRLIKQAGVPWWVSSVLLYSLVLAAAGGLLAVLIAQNGVYVLVAVAVMGLLPTAYLNFLRGRRFKVCAKLLPDAVELMTRALRAGHALNSALEMVSTDIPEPLSSEFRAVYEEQTLGLPLRDALENLLQRIPSADMEFLIAALLLQKDTGGNLAQILDKTSSLMKDRTRLRGQVRTHTAQARISGWVLGALPFFMYLGMNFLNPGYESALFADPLGIKLVYAGFVMLAIGILVIRKIVDIRI